MYRLFTATVLLASASMAADMVAPVRKALAGDAAVRKVTQAQGAVTVHTSHRMFRFELYPPLVYAACAANWAGAGDVKELRFVNFADHSGWVFENPLENCAEVRAYKQRKLTITPRSDAHRLELVVSFYTHQFGQRAKGGQRGHGDNLIAGFRDIHDK